MALLSAGNLSQGHNSREQRDNNCWPENNLEVGAKALSYFSSSYDHEGEQGKNRADLAVKKWLHVMNKFLKLQFHAELKKIYLETNIDMRNTMCGKINQFDG